ncbi:hypothetical protein HV011_11320 [Citrobacter freundii]|jgi:hypothetical protein|nr:hypothetical protein [Citrobacter freundii]QMB04052.1 hypothetical protein HV011_11320 [Citrobacter freundii]
MSLTHPFLRQSTLSYHFANTLLVLEQSGALLTRVISQRERAAGLSRYS